MELYCLCLRAKSRIMNMMTDEQGDTNFISIIVILGIVLGLAALFSKNIGELVTSVWNSIAGNSKDVLDSMSH